MGRKDSIKGAGRASERGNELRTMLSRVRFYQSIAASLTTCAIDRCKESSRGKSRIEKEGEKKIEKRSRNQTSSLVRVAVAKTRRRREEDEEEKGRGKEEDEDEDEEEEEE